MKIKTKFKHLLKTITKSKIAKATFVVCCFVWLITNMFPPLSIFLYPILFVLILLLPFSAIYLLYSIKNFIQDEFEGFYIASSKLIIPFIMSLVIYFITSKIGEYQFNKSGILVEKLITNYEIKYNKVPANIKSLEIKISMENIFYYWFISNMIVEDGKISYPATIMDRYFWNNEKKEWINH
jgi:hypothetical protein